MIDISEDSLLSFFDKRTEARKDFDNRLANITNKFFEDNHIPLRVGDKVTYSYDNVTIRTGTIKFIQLADNRSEVLKTKPKVAVFVNNYGYYDFVPIEMLKKV